jgi:hypothetical protein
MMSSGGSYVIKDATESLAFPAPTTEWQDQKQGEGLNGLPAFNAYRLHIWRWSGLDENYMAKLAAFQTRQQTNTAQPTSVETDPYDPRDDCEEYRTAVYTDAIIKSIARGRGYGMHDNPSVTFEILVS